MNNKKNIINKVGLSIVIPVLNEGANLKILLRILKAVVDTPYEVLVVYDLPNDNSIPIVKSMQKDYNGLNLVYNNLGRGVINAIKSGVNSAVGEYVLIIAADDIGPPLAINDMFFLMNQGCDLVNATRYAYGGKNIGGTIVSKFFSRIANKMFHTLSRCALTDPTFGVKMFKRSLFDKINLKPQKIVFADDEKRNLLSIEKMAKENNIKFVGLRFNYTDTKVANYKLNKEIIAPSFCSKPLPKTKKRNMLDWFRKKI